MFWVLAAHEITAQKQLGIDMNIMLKFNMIAYEWSGLTQLCKLIFKNKTNHAICFAF